MKHLATLLLFFVLFLGLTVSTPEVAFAAPKLTKEEVAAKKAAVKAATAARKAAEAAARSAAKKPKPKPTPTPKPSPTPPPATPTPTPTPVPTLPPPTPTPTAPVVDGPLSVFPGAVGFGTHTVAGSGRHLSPPSTTVVRVTSLADSGAGSLRECIQRATPRVCVFDISGRIELKTRITIDQPYLTVAGQTAPSPGVLITGAGIRISTHDVLIQHLQILVGDDPSGPEPSTRDGINIAGKSTSPAWNVVLDHISLGWSIDENFDAWYANTSDVTLSNSIVAEALYDSIHPKGPHSMGMLIGMDVKRVSIRGNVLAHNNDRNPRIECGSSAEFIGNVVYDWGGTTSWNQANLSDLDRTGRGVDLVFAGNMYKPGPSSPTKSLATVFGNPPAIGSRIFVRSNLGPTRQSEGQNEWAIAGIDESSFRMTAPPFAANVSALPSATDSLQSVLLRAGSRPKESNSVDRRIISEVTLGTGTLKDCVSGCARNGGGYPLYPSTVRPLLVPSNPHGDDDRNGYTNLEDWLHAQARDVEQP